MILRKKKKFKNKNIAKNTLKKTVVCADKPRRLIVLGCSANQPADKTPEEQQQEEEEEQQKEWLWYYLLLGLVVLKRTNCFLLE